MLPIQTNSLIRHSNKPTRIRVDPVLKGEYQPEFEDQVRELGMLMAAGMDNDVF